MPLEVAGARAKHVVAFARRLGRRGLPVGAAFAHLLVALLESTPRK